MPQKGKKISLSRPGASVDVSSVLNPYNGQYLAQLIEQHANDSASVDPSLSYLLSELGDGLSELKPRGFSKESRLVSSLGASSRRKTNVDSADSSWFSLSLAIRDKGHMAANIDPLGMLPKQDDKDLSPLSYGLPSDGGVYKDRLEKLKSIYCSSIGFDCAHVQIASEKQWLQWAMESEDYSKFSADERLKILSDLTKAESFEKFLSIKFPGAKRFGLEGGESFIPFMEEIISRSASHGMQETVIGMAHRGRLNVLTNIVGKLPRIIVAEFQGKAYNKDISHGSGDVKYHMGYSGERNMHGKSVYISLMHNPSHLEAVNPLVLGKVRSRQRLLGDVDRQKVTGILVHGDAAFSGQGIVSETLLLANLNGYTVGGSVHVIVNNQVGFTTSPNCSRSSFYSSELAKAIQAPIFHVNGDDPEAVLRVARIAVDYKYRFKKDVVIDLYCYRRNGHNEMDDPSFTQPLMYENIRSRKSIREIYGASFAVDEAESILKSHQDYLQQEFEAASSYKSESLNWLEGAWGGFTHDIKSLDVETGVEIDALNKIGSCLVSIPDGFNIHTRLERLLQQKKQIFDAGDGCDWATAEALAFGSLLLDGHHVRLSGQDCGRGTFSHRHSVFVDQKGLGTHIPLNNLSPVYGKAQATFEVFDSPLSEFAVLGFELGYSMADPKALTIWEAQFGDFANGAQVIFDQFLSSSEAKWLRLSGLVLLLPHGYEGQGPEHSSARLERYLQLCAEDNMIVANCTTAANYFHILRRQVVSKCRKPLIIMSPKSLLRDKNALSQLTSMGPGTRFSKVLDDRVKMTKPSRVVLCSGKVAYEIMDARDKHNLNVMVLRLEQLYPFPADDLCDVLASYKDSQFVWAQEEPQNMGAWHYIDRRLEEVLLKIGAKHNRPIYVGRKAAAATATGYGSIHEKEQGELVRSALNVKEDIK